MVASITCNFSHHVMVERRGHPPIDTHPLTPPKLQPKSKKKGHTAHA